MKRKWPFFAVGAVVLVGFLISLGIREQSSEVGKLSELRAKARERSIPLSVDEFIAFAKPRSDADNAGPDLLKTIQALRPGALGGEEHPNEFGVTATELEELQAVVRSWRRGQSVVWLNSPYRQTLDRIQPVFVQLESALEKPSLYFEKDWRKAVVVAVNELSELLRLGRLAVIDGLIKAKSGRLEEGFARLELAADLAIRTASMPLFMFVRTAASLGSDVVEALLEILAESQASETLFSRLQVISAKLDLGPAVLPALKGYVCLNLVSLDLLSSRERMEAAGIEDRQMLRTVPKPEVRRQTEIDVLTHAIAIFDRFPKSGFDPLKVRQALGRDDREIDDAMSLFFPSLWRRTLEADTSESSFGRMLQFLEALTARQRILRGAIAVLQAQSQPGTYPDALPISGSDGIDPFSGEPLRYSRDGEGFTLYSVGINRKDDKGVDTPTDGFSLDLVFRYPAGSRF